MVLEKLECLYDRNIYLPVAADCAKSIIGDSVRNDNWKEIFTVKIVKVHFYEIVISHKNKNSTDQASVNYQFHWIGLKIILLKTERRKN